MASKERGHITQRGNSYRVMVSYQDDTGKRQQLTATARTVTEAKKVRTRLLSQVDHGEIVRPGKLTVGKYLQQWLDGLRSTVSPNTCALYSYISHNHLIPALGNITLSQLKPQHIQSLYSDKLAQGLSPRTVQLCHVVLHKSLDNAVRTNLILRNPTNLVDQPRVERHEIRIMSESDISLFLDEARKTDYYSLFYVLLFTGLRRGEALSLRWDDADLIGCQLSISRTMQFINNKVTFKSPKTGSSRRQIALSPSTCVVLRLHRETQDALRHRFGLPSVSDSDLIFCQYDGKPLLPNSVTHVWIKVARRCGLQGVRLHDARHTHASLLLKQGVSPKVISERLGHSSIEVTLNLYAHTTRGMQQDAANKFDDIVIRSESVTNPLPSTGTR